MDKLISQGMTINQIAVTHHQWVANRAMDMGWRDNTPLEYMALLAGEVGAAVNALTEVRPTFVFGSRLADIILMTLDLAKQQGINIDYEITSKLISNHA